MLLDVPRGVPRRLVADPTGGGGGPPAARAGLVRWVPGVYGAPARTDPEEAPGTHRPHLARVPRVPAGRHRAAAAGAGLLLAGVCGLCAAWGRAVLDSVATWPAVVVSGAALVAALTLHSRVRHDLPGRLWLRGTVLVGRTPLGGHGVDLARVTAVSVGSDPEPGGIVSLRLTAGDEHSVAAGGAVPRVQEPAQPAGGRRSSDATSAATRARTTSCEVQPAPRRRRSSPPE